MERSRSAGTKDSPRINKKKKKGFGGRAQVIDLSSTCKNLVQFLAPKEGRKRGRDAEQIRRGSEGLGGGRGFSGRGQVESRCIHGNATQGPVACSKLTVSLPMSGCDNASQP
jgi:hypothetical protein